MTALRLSLSLLLLLAALWLAWEVRRLAGEVRALREGLREWKTW